MEEIKDPNLLEALLPEHVHMCHYKHNKNLHRMFSLNQYFSFWQLALFIALLYSFCFQGLIAYNLYLLEIEPEYLCWYKGSQEAVPCKTIDLKRAEKWIYDSTGNNLNLDNWFTRLHFENIEKWKIGMIGSVYFFGFIGGSFLTRFADIYGRKPFVIIGGFLQTICGFMLIIANNLILIYVNLFLIGIASPLLSSVGYNYMMELVPRNKQNFVNTILMCTDSFGSLLGILYFMYVSSNIDYFILIIAILGLICSLFHLYTPESPMFSTIKKEGETDLHHEETADEIKFHQTSICDFVTDSTLFLNIVIMMGVWSVSSGGYYLINFNMKYVGGSMLSNIIASVSSEFMANIASLVMLSCIGDKLTLVCFFLISACSGFIFCSITLTSLSTALLILLSKFGISAAFCSVFVVTSKVFPPVYVATAFGICNIIGRSITSLSPLITELPKPYPMFIFAVACSIVCLSVFGIRLKKDKQ